MRQYNINTNIIRATETLHDKAQSVVLFNDSTGDWFRTAVGVRQGSLTNPPSHIPKENHVWGIG